MPAAFGQFVVHRREDQGVDGLVRGVLEPVEEEGPARARQDFVEVDEESLISGGALRGTRTGV